MKIKVRGIRLERRLWRQWRERNFISIFVIPVNLMSLNIQSWYHSFYWRRGWAKGWGQGGGQGRDPTTHSSSSITHTHTHLHIHIHIHIHLFAAEDRAEAEEKIIRDKEAALKEKAARDQRTDLKSRYSISSYLTVSHRIVLYVRLIYTYHSATVLPGLLILILLEHSLLCCDLVFPSLNILLYSHHPLFSFLFYFLLNPFELTLCYCSCLTFSHQLNCSQGPDENWRS